MSACRRDYCYSCCHVTKQCDGFCGRCGAYVGTEKGESDDGPRRDGYGGMKCSLIGQ